MLRAYTPSGAALSTGGRSSDAIIRTCRKFRGVVRSGNGYRHTVWPDDAAAERTECAADNDVRTRQRRSARQVEPVRRHVDPERLQVDLRRNSAGAAAKPEPPHYRRVCRRVPAPPPP